MIKEFREFAMRGNVIDLAVGVIIGGAFGKIVNSLVNDIIMPPFGALIGGVKFSDLSLIIKEKIIDASGVEIAPAVTLNYGNFIQMTFEFLIIAFAIFMMIKAINVVRRKKEETPASPPEPSAQEKLLMEIRDLLKK
ncbi:MAG: large-conductance mechanosensitive channel protein MscL [Candidatus Competibacteraceae bacterium]|nr:large-conductance mechanosensitive channel protein MscL [Candidatus Competibacteraceae bacterium]